MELDIIVNPKTTDDGQAVIQLETAAGDAIKHFNNAHGVNVPRSRFLPVKSCSDLLLIKSDIYSLQHGQLIINPNRMFETTPVIKLGDHFKKIAQFQKRFKKIPKIIELDHLTVTGDVYFGRNVTLRGAVIVVANEGQRIDIPDGCVLENRLLSGNLNMIVRPLLLLVCCGGTHRRRHVGTMIILFSTYLWPVESASLSALLSLLSPTMDALLHYINSVLSSARRDPSFLFHVSGT